MLISAGLLKWTLRLYPPLLFQRIWVMKIAADFTAISIRIKKSFFNINYNRSIFGGTIFSAADVCYPVLFHQLLSHKGYKVAVWSRSAEIKFLKKSHSQINFSVNLCDEDIQHVEQVLTDKGKYNRAFPIKMYNNNGDVCVEMICEVYVRNLNFIKTPGEKNLHE